MPSIEAKLKEHSKYKKQCEIRVKSGSKLIATSLLITLSITWFVPWFWKLGLGWVAFVSVTTFLEYLSAKKHSKAIKELTNT